MPHSDVVMRILSRARIGIARFGIHARYTSLTSQAIREILDLFRPLNTGHPLVRIGGSGDGGYLVPDDLQGLGGVFSPGVGKLSAFEAHFARLGVPCFMIDGSVDAPVVNHELFHFEKLWLGTVDSTSSVSLTTWINTSGIEGDLLLQMDIEGGEYEVLISCPPETLKRFRIIAVEFHFLDSIFSPPGRAALLACMQKLSLNHRLVHTHVNNHGLPLNLKGYDYPQVLELTFLRSDRCGEEIDFPVFSEVPHPLDEPNDPSRRDWHLSWPSPSK